MLGRKCERWIVHLSSSINSHVESKLKLAFRHTVVRFQTSWLSQERRTGEKFPDLYDAGGETGWSDSPLWPEAPLVHEAVTFFISVAVHSVSLAHLTIFSGYLCDSLVMLTWESIYYLQSLVCFFILAECEAENRWLMAFSVYFLKDVKQHIYWLGSCCNLLVWAV